MADAGLQTLSIQTVESLLNALEDGGFNPVVARNYENFPNFGHDLDLFVGRELSDAVDLFRGVAKELNWDRLTLCDHYAAFDDDSLRIPVFRFHQFEPLQTLQVDLFGGLILWGLPLRTRHQICAERQLEPRGRFHTMPPEWEQGYRIFQIQSLHPIKHAPKRTRYRERVITFDDQHKGALDTWGVAHGMGTLEAAVSALRDQDTDRLDQVIRQAKRRFALGQMMRHPLRTMLRIKDRRRGLSVQFNERPCGPKVHLEGEPHEWSTWLDFLVEKQAFFKRCHCLL